MHIVRVTLSDMLDAREQRQNTQRMLLQRYRLPLICFTMNIAGEVKDTPAIRFAFSSGLSELKRMLPDEVYAAETYGATGCVAYLVYDLPPHAVKAVCERIENTPIGRLYDMDVLDAAGEKLSRAVTRSCLVCGGPVTDCARSRAHGLEAVSAATDRLLLAFCSERMRTLAVSALWDEVHLTPKPGLVDEANNGAHSDMDVSLFEKSAQTLGPFFERAFRLGVEPGSGFQDLQRLGTKAEQEMFRTTGGVNTHKGVIYSFLILLAAFGRTMMRGGDAFEEVVSLSRRDTRIREAGSHGTVGYLKYGASGARGEALEGFPHARKACIYLKKADELDALLFLLSEVDDTNVLHRGGAEAQQFLHAESARIRHLEDAARHSALCELDALCIVRNISPGGCADMLAMALFLDRTRAFWEE